MRRRRILRRVMRVVVWLFAIATLVGTGPIIWRDALYNAQTYLHTSRPVSEMIIVVPIGAILLLVLFVRARNWFKVQRRHRSVRQDALRNLRL